MCFLSQRHDATKANTDRTTTFLRQCSFSANPSQINSQTPKSSASVDRSSSQTRGKSRTILSNLYWVNCLGSRPRLSNSAISWARLALQMISETVEARIRIHKFSRFDTFLIQVHHMSISALTSWFGGSSGWTSATGASNSITWCEDGFKGFVKRDLSEEAPALPFKNPFRHRRGFSMTFVAGQQGHTEAKSTASFEPHAFSLKVDMRLHRLTDHFSEKRKCYLH